VPVKTIEEAARAAADADAVLGYCSSDIVTSGKGLRWIQVGHAGVEKDLVPELKASEIVLTNLQRLHGPNVADQAMALLLALTRNIPRGPILGYYPQRPGSTYHWQQLKQRTHYEELHGKTMLIVGLGGIGTQIARRAEACGMRVMAIDANSSLVKPAFVFSIDRPDQLLERLAQADVVVLACPLTEKTRGMFGKEQFQTMKKSAYFINIARGGLVKTDDLVKALTEKQIAGAGMDVTDPEPLPDDHPLWAAGALVSPHIGGQSSGALDRQWRLFRENVRRFVAGEPLLCVVDKQKGY
jgi:phosphoglycerate dehydrogenase-like enzyme